MIPIFSGIVCFVFMLGILSVPDNAAAQCPVPSKIAQIYLDRIFSKYGQLENDNTTVITVQGLDQLMSNLSLGAVSVRCEVDDYECMKTKYKKHGLKDPLLLKRKRRGAGGSSPAQGQPSAAAKKQHEQDWRAHLNKCLVTANITTMFMIDNKITQEQFINVCPTLLQQIEAGVCTHFHERYPAFVNPDKPPTTSETWGYGFLAISICSFLSLGVIMMIPCLKKSYYSMIMAYLVALAVGTLAGDAMLHLIPHAFIEGANLAGGVVVSKRQRLLQHYSQVWRAMFVLAGIYLFFCVEMIMKMRASRSHSGHNHGKESSDDIAEEMINHADEDHSGEDKVESGHSHGAHKHEVDGHGHSHGGDKPITGETKVSSVAWMVIVGDGFHNFSDGLAVGAAFSASLSSGVSTTIAIFCHELPHELGDFAILLKAGMTIRQAIVYNLVSTVLAFIGLALGIVAGTGELGRHIILCLTAGLFLYISLVDMMKEIGETEVGSHKFLTPLLQHLGLLSGMGIMLFISLFEDKM